MSKPGWYTSGLLFSQKADRNFQALSGRGCVFYNLKIKDRVSNIAEPLLAHWANMYTVSRLLFECMVGVWIGLGSVYVSSRWLGVSSWVELLFGASVCVCVCVCWCDMSTHAFIIYVILYLNYRFLYSIICLCCCKCKSFGVLLHVLKLMSLILVKLNCPVRDDSSFLTWLSILSSLPLSKFVTLSCTVTVIIIITTTALFSFTNF